jgi:hypothetical protein
MFEDVSVEHIASNFRADKYAKQINRQEAGGILFLRNGGELPPDYNVLVQRDSALYFVMLTLMSLPGACHGDEIPYLFRVEMLKVDLEPGTPEYVTSLRMAKLWTNFAKTG